MRKFLLCVGLLLGIHVSLLAQIQEITNVLTPQHQEIKGTKFMLVLPDTSFNVSKEFTGFYSEFLQLGINVTETPMPFNEFILTLTKDVKENDNAVLVNKDLTINGLQAKLFKMRITERTVFEELENKPASDRMLWTLVCGNDKNTFIVSTGYFTDLDTMYATKFEQSLLSFLYLPDKQVNPFDQLQFLVNIENTPLKFATIMMQTGALFNTSGEFPSEKEEEAMYLILPFSFEIKTSEAKARAKEIVKSKYEENDIEIETVKPIKVGELSAYEVIAYRGKGKNKEELLYGALILDKDKHFRVNAFAKKDLENCLKTFKAITQSFQTK